MNKTGLAWFNLILMILGGLGCVGSGRGGGVGGEGMAVRLLTLDLSIFSTYAYISADNTKW